MNSSYLSRILQISLLLSQHTQPTAVDNPLFQIKITASELKDNLNTNLPFRGLMFKNAISNCCRAKSDIDNENYLKASESLLFAACSILTALTYPADSNWSTYYRKTASKEQLLIMSAICFISCGNATFNPVFKDVQQVSLAEKLIYAGICFMPFFNSFQHFAFNVNK